MAQSSSRRAIGAVRPAPNAPSERPLTASRTLTHVVASRHANAGSIACMGPLHGVRILEFEAIGPAPFCSMLLADMGADVLLVDRIADARLGFGRERWY